MDIPEGFRRRIWANALLNELAVMQHCIENYEKKISCREAILSSLRASFDRLVERWPRYLKEIEMWPSNYGETQDSRHLTQSEKERTCPIDSPE